MACARHSAFCARCSAIPSFAGASTSPRSWTRCSRMSGTRLSALPCVTRGGGGHVVLRHLGRGVGEQATKDDVDAEFKSRVGVGVENVIESAVDVRKPVCGQRGHV